MTRARRRRSCVARTRERGGRRPRYEALAWETQRQYTTWKILADATPSSTYKVKARLTRFGTGCPAAPSLELSVVVGGAVR